MWILLEQSIIINFLTMYELSLIVILNFHISICSIHCCSGVAMFWFIAAEYIKVLSWMVQPHADSKLHIQLWVLVVWALATFKVIQYLSSLWTLQELLEWLNEVCGWQEWNLGLSFDIFFCALDLFCGVRNALMGGSSLFRTVNRLCCGFQN